MPTASVSCASWRGERIVLTQTQIASEEHEEHDKLMKAVQAGIDALLNGADGNGNGGDDETTRAALLDDLKANLSRFGKELIEHLDHEEHSFATPVARKVSLGLLALWGNQLVRERTRFSQIVQKCFRLRSAAFWS